jgi:ATP-dependent Clp protease ATP-binding subunit ClpB
MAAAPPLSADVLSFLASAPAAAAPTPVVAAAWGAARAGAVRGKAALRTTTRGGRGGLLAPVVGGRPRRTPLSVRCNATSRDGRVRTRFHCLPFQSDFAHFFFFLFIL